MGKKLFVFNILSKDVIISLMIMKQQKKQAKPKKFSRKVLENVKAT